MLRQKYKLLWRGGFATKKCVAFLSTLASDADDVITYVRSQGKSDTDQAVDILRSAAARHDGVQAGRLHLALAEIAMERSQWDEAIAHASTAAAVEALRDDSTRLEGGYSAHQVQQQAIETGVRSLLVQGNDTEAVSLASQGLHAAESAPPESTTLTQRWQSITEAQARLGLAQLAAGDRGAKSSMKAAFSLINNQDAARGPVDGPNADLSTLPMLPKDVYVPGAMQRYGAWAYAEGNLIHATRFLQKAAMAAEAARVEAEDSGQVPLLAASLPEVTLAAFAGHVQTEIARARDQVAWRRAEVHLESALERAEAISGHNHPRVIPMLMFLADIYAHTQRVTLAEGLYRKAVKLLYRTPAPGSTTLVLRQQPSPVHSSLETLLAWRFAQLLTALPKRGSEAESYIKHAQDTFSGSEGDLEAQYGHLESLKGTAGTAPCAGVFVDVSLRRALPCHRSFVDDLGKPEESLKDSSVFWVLLIGFVSA